MKTLTALLTICYLAIVLSLCGICTFQVAEVKVNLRQDGKKVNSNQFGIFFEEINHAGDGGIYAELVRNGSFMEASTLDAWAAVQVGAAKVHLFFDNSMPLNPVNHGVCELKSTLKAERKRVSPTRVIGASL